MKENEKQIHRIKSNDNKISKINSSELYEYKKNQPEPVSTVTKSKLISKLLNSFAKNIQNKYFDIMSIDIINFNISQENNDTIEFKTSNEITFKNILYNLLEKNLIEIIYISDSFYRDERISRLYYWYKEQLKKFEDIKYINKKSYKDINSVDDGEYFKKKLEQMKKDNEYLTGDRMIKEQMSHRTQGPFDKKMLNDYKRVQIYNKTYYKKIHKNKNKLNQSKELEKEEKLKPVISPVLKKNLSPQNIPFGDYSTFYSSFRGTNNCCIKKINDNNYDIPEGGEKERTFYTNIKSIKRSISPDFNNEIKSSYSYNRPPIDFNILSVEKIINENKNKLIYEKRYDEEMNKKIDKYGIDRSHYKENILKKYELKDIINMYIKTKKINSKLFKQKAKNVLNSNKNNFLNKRAIQAEITDKTNMTTNTTNLSNSTPNQLIPKINSGKNIYQPKNVELVNKNIFKSPKMEKKGKEIDIARTMKRHYTLGDMQISKYLRRMGDKIIIDEIKNINQSTKEINDQPEDKIYKFNIQLKYTKESIKNNFIKTKINNENNDNKTPNDIVYRLISEEPLFKQKLISDNICNITAKMNDKRFLSEPFSEDESIYHNFCLSAYNSKNMKIIERNKNKLQNDVKILRHISPCSKNIGKKKLLDENDSFNNYKNDYLNLRKTIGEWKKYECEELLNKIKSNKKEGIDDDNNNNNNLNKEKNNKNKDAFVYKIKKQKILINAILNPNEDNTFPKYYLPKPGENLLSKIEINTTKKKNKKKK